MRRAIAAIGLLSVACATATREAEPLEIEVLAPAPTTPVIKRAVLADVLSRGPGRFLERMPVSPALDGRKFSGYRIVELYGRATPHPLGVRVGDVVTAVNGVAIQRPEHLMTIWGGLKTAKALTVDVVRAGQVTKVTYVIEE